jgi:hypothetical protein
MLLKYLRETKSMSSIDRDPVDRFVNDKIMPWILTLCATFLKGLTLKRNQTFVAVECRNMIAFDARTKKYNIEPPYLTELMAKYVVTQICPFRNMINFAENVSAETAELDAIVNKFNTITESLYDPMYLSELKSNKCWPKSHALKTEEQTAKRKRQGQADEFKEEFKTKIKVQFMEPGASKVLLKTKKSLTEFLKLQSMTANNTSDSFLFEQIKGAAEHNNLNIALPELSDKGQQLYRALMWIITAYTDWLGIDYIETPDVRAALGVMLSTPNSIVSDEAITNLMVPNPELPEALKNLVFDNIVMNNDLYISEPTMIRLASALLRMIQQEMPQSVLAFNGLLSLI